MENLTKARLIEQYELVLSKREMAELMLALRVFVRDYEASEPAEALLDLLEQVYVGPNLGAGLDVAPTTPVRGTRAASQARRAARPKPGKES